MDVHRRTLDGLPSLADLALLLAVVRTGSIGAAAQLADMSQPALSRRMSDLERRLRVILLARSRRGTTLTPAGQAVVDWAETLLARAEEFDRLVATLRSNGPVAVRAAVSMTIAEHLAPQWLAKVHHFDPELRISLVVQNSSHVVDLVERGEVDVGFVESPTVADAVARSRIGWDDLVVAVHPDHAWASEEAIDVSELAESYLLVREPGSGTRDTLDLAMASRGLTLRSGMVMTSNSALRAAAASGVGPVVLSRMAVAGEVELSRLRIVPVTGLELRRPLTAVWSRGAELKTPVKTLLAVAHESVA